jgi:hypothetical protein
MIRVFLVLILAVIELAPACARGRWSESEANAWYARQPWLVGVNFIPSSAVNQLEMFQMETFDPVRIDRELALAQSLRMGAVRVFLHDQLWEADSDGFKRRIDAFLTIAQRHGIKTIPVLFDSCWDPDPKLGPQPPPIPGVHNSRWVQSPGRERLTDPAYEPKLDAYVRGVVRAFAHDGRILAWDIWNEPDNGFGESVQDLGLKLKRVNALLPKAFGWARAEDPSQPLTSAVWAGDWSDPAKASATTLIQLAQSDVVSFHDYSPAHRFEERIRELLPQHRPIMCTEYMARTEGSTFEGSLPIARRYKVAAISWGLVAGKTQTWLPWDSWERPYVDRAPATWFHDIFRSDGTAYRPRETEFIRELTTQARPLASNPAPVPAQAP